MKLMERVYSVLVISSAKQLNAVLMEMLHSPVYDYIKQTASVSTAQRMLAERSFDLVIINSPLRDDPGLRLAMELCENDRTIVLMIVRTEQYYDISAKLRPHGVFMVSRPLSRQSLESALQWMASARERLRKIEKKTVSIEEKMKEIRLINRAKWLLIRELNMDETSAHKYIEKQAMDRCISRREIAEELIKVYS